MKGKISSSANNTGFSSNIHRVLKVRKLKIYLTRECFCFLISFHFWCLRAKSRFSESSIQMFKIHFYLFFGILTTKIKNTYSFYIFNEILNNSIWYNRFFLVLNFEIPSTPSTTFSIGSNTNDILKVSSLWMIRLEFAYRECWNSKWSQIRGWRDADNSDKNIQKFSCTHEKKKKSNFSTTVVCEQTKIFKEITRLLFSSTQNFGFLCKLNIAYQWKVDFFKFLTHMSSILSIAFCNFKFCNKKSRKLREKCFFLFLIKYFDSLLIKNWC